MSAPKVNVLGLMDLAIARAQEAGGPANGYIAARAAVAELIAAAQAALEDDGGTKYDGDGEWDSVGLRSCCNVLSYKPHAAGCWVPALRDALAKVQS
jgi:hypothetical protein